jgi:hypothetical protein
VELSIYYNVNELLIYSDTNSLKYKVDLGSLQVASPNGQIILSMNRSERGVRKLLMMDFCSKHHGEVVLFDAHFSLTLELKSFWKGNWFLKLNEEELNIHRYYGYRSSLFFSGERFCSVDYIESYNESEGRFVLKFQEEKYALCMIAFMMVTYFIDGPEGRNLTPSYRWWR